MTKKQKDLLLQFSDAQDLAPDHMRHTNRPLKVVLIQPPTSHGVRSLLPHIDNDGGEGIGFKPPLGILYIATLLESQSPHKVLVIDAQAERLGYDEIVQRVVDFEADVVGISAWTDFWYPSYRTGELIAHACPSAHLSYGGPHIGIYSSETLAVPFVDSVIVGDGEVPFLYLCNMLSHDIQDNDFPGLHLKGHGVKGGNETNFVHRDLDALPIPNRTLLPIKHYGSVLSKGQLVTTMITSRGCPHQCTFCKLNFQKNVARTAASVIEEFRQIHALGIREVEIYDDTFTWSRKRLIEICEGLINADLGVEWAVRDRVSSATVDLDVMMLMRRAGCRRIHYGIESGVQTVIDRMKKRIMLDQARKAVELAKQAKITVLTYFMFGNLDETADDMRKTIDFALSLDSDFAQFSVTIPYAGTEMYTEALANNIIEHDYWGDYARAPVPDFLPPRLIEDKVDVNTMLELCNEAVRRFYFRPRFIFRELWRLRNLREFMRKGLMGIQLARSVYIK